MIATPPIANHGVDSNIAAFNVKQTGSQTVHQPIAVSFNPPMPLAMQQLTLHVENASIRCASTCYSSSSQTDSIDMEWQVTVTYKVGP